MLIIHNNLLIRSATIQDANLLCNWWNDGTIMNHAGFPNGLGTSVEEVIPIILRSNVHNNQLLIIEVEQVPIGEMNYTNIGNGCVEIGIKICDLTKQDKGYGKVILSMLIQYLYHNLGYKKIILDTNLNNTRAQHVYTQLGFRQVKVNIDAWRNQLGELQSSVEYELEFDHFNNYAIQ